MDNFWGYSLDKDYGNTTKLSLDKLIVTATRPRRRFWIYTTSPDLGNAATSQNI
jgi:hypothetical protein